MKRVRTLLIFATALLCPGINATVIYLNPRPIAFDQTYQLALNNYTMFNAELSGTHAFNFFVSPLYQKSFDPEHLGSLFNPSCCRNTLEIAESGAGDVGSLWLQLISPASTSFSSKVTLRPQEETYGGFVLMQTNFNNHIEGLWMSAATAFIKRKRNLRLVESDQLSSGTLPGLSNATEALANPDWKFGKLAWKNLCVTGVDDVEVRLGYNYECETYWAGFYALGGIPTGNRMNAEYLFEPTVGSRHGCLGFGAKASCSHELSCAKLTFMTDFKYRYQFRAREFRMYDLCPNGAWSRYLLLVNANERLNPQPAINQLATFLDVKPGNTIDWWSAFNFDFCCFEIETGWSLWYQQKESICLSHCYRAPAGVVGIYDMPNRCAINPETCPLAQISSGVLNSAPSSSSFVQLRPENFDIESAASPKRLSFKSYIAGNYQISRGDYPSSIGIVAAYDSSCTNVGIDTWSLWFTIALGF